MPDNNKLLQVKITIDDQGKIGKVVHPDCKLNRDADLPFSGRQYGWRLAGYNDTGLDLKAFFAQAVDVATNSPDKKEDFNTIQFRGPELLKLDVGHWGAYHRWREYPGGPDADDASKEKGIQREFGLIENHHVWLCRFNGQQAVPATLSNFQSAKATLAAQILNNLAPGFGIDIVADAPVTDPRSAELDNQTLYVIFPDLHLPETLPDFPLPAQRHPVVAARPTPQRNPNADARKALRKFLVNAQHQPGWLGANPLGESDQQKVQAYLEAIHVEPGAPLPEQPLWPVKPGLLDFWKPADFSPEQFLAEKAIVDREIMLTGTWFYARGPGWKKEAQTDRDTWAAADDDGDPTPAIELAHLLCAIKKARQDSAANIQVIQVGDLYELWLNHEFLYRDFLVDTSFNVSGAEKRAYFGIWQQGSKSDDYQYRLDAGLQNSAGGGSAKEKRYVYNYWPKADMLLRYRIGEPMYAGLDDDDLLEELSLRPPQLQRVQGLLKDRVDRVRAYSLHQPNTPACASLLAMDPAVLDFKYFYRRQRDLRKGGTEYGPGQETEREYFIDPNGRKEVFWNEMILKLLGDLDFRNIGGNHDGYRSDPLVNVLLDDVDQAETVISEPGLWIEHSHRWDEFNRDGMAFGAGAANYVYYYFTSLCSKSAGWWEDMLGQQEQKCFVPGAAFWFGVANFGDDLKWAADQGIPGSVQPFGVYVSGHTHSASLARITFDLPPKLKQPKPAVPAAQTADPNQTGPTGW